MAYSLGMIKTEGIYFSQIEGIDLEHRYGEHGVLKIHGTINQESAADQMNELRDDTVFSMFIEERGGKTELFHGLVIEAEMEERGGMYKLCLTVISLSYQMDIRKKSRSFQNTAMTYHQLVQHMMKDYPGADVKLSFLDQPLGVIAVQYEETDWEFLKRMLSLIYQPLSCAVAGKRIQLYGGVLQAEESHAPGNVTEYHKDMDLFFFWKEMGENVQETDFFFLKGDTCSVFQLYDSITFQGTSFLISDVHIYGEKGILKTCFTASRKEGVLKKPVYPVHLIGMSLEGSVTGISGNKIRVQLNIDKQMGTAGIYWFPYSTLSASPDGSGWYCMPEKGDMVRVNFPSKNTGDAIAISSVSSYDGKGGKDRMGKPETKYLRTKEGQQMSLGANGVNLSNGPSKLKIEKGGEISLNTSESIVISASEKIELQVTGKLCLHSKTQGYYSGKTGNVVLTEEGNMQIQGENLDIG